MKSEQFPSEADSASQEKLTTKKERTPDELIQAFTENSHVIRREGEDTTIFHEWIKESIQELAPDKDFSSAEFLLEDSKDINAQYAHIGGKDLFIFTKGIIKYVDNKDQLVGVEAHELVHKLLRDELGEGYNSHAEEKIAYVKPVELLHAAGYDARQVYEFHKKLQRDSKDTVGQKILKILDVHGSDKGTVLAIKDYTAALDSRVGGLKIKPRQLDTPDVVASMKFKGYFDEKKDKANFTKISLLEKIEFLKSHIDALGGIYTERLKDFISIVNDLPDLTAETFPVFSNLIETYLQSDSAIMEELPTGSNKEKEFSLGVSKTKNILMNIYDFSWAKLLESKEQSVVTLARAFGEMPEWYKHKEYFHAFNQIIDAQVIKDRDDLEMLESTVQKYAEKDYIPKLYPSLAKAYTTFIDRRITNAENNETLFTEFNKNLELLPPWINTLEYIPGLNTVLEKLLKADPEYFKQNISAIPFSSIQTQAQKFYTENTTSVLESGTDVPEKKERKLKPLSEFNKEEQVTKLKTHLDVLLTQARNIAVTKEFVGHKKEEGHEYAFLQSIKESINSLAKASPESIAEYIPQFLYKLSAEVSGDIRVNPMFGEYYVTSILSLPSTIISTETKLKALTITGICEFEMEAEVNRILPEYKSEFEHIQVLISEGYNLQNQIERFFGRTPKTITDCIDFYTVIKEQNKEFADQYLRVMLFSKLQKFSKAISAYEIIHLLDKNPTGMLIQMVRADRFITQALSYEINNEHRWPEPIDQLVDLYRILDTQELFPRGSDAQSKMGAKIITYIEQCEDFDETIRLGQVLLTGKRLNEPVLRKRLIDSHINTISKKYGQDDGSEKYVKRAEEAAELLKGVNLVDRFTLANGICDAVISQKETSYLYRDAVIGEGVSRENLLESSIHLVKGELYFKVLDFYSEKEDLIRFALRPYKQYTADAIASEIAANLKRDGGPLEFDQDFLAYYAQSDEKYITKKTSELMRLFHQNFWSSSFLVRTAIVDHMLHEEKKKEINEDAYDTGTPAKVSAKVKKTASPWDKGYRIISSELFPKEHPHRESMEVFLKGYLDVIPEYQKSLFLSALMTAQQQTQEKTQHTIGDTLARILELLGPAEIKVGQVAHSYPGTPIDIADGLGRLKSGADIPPRWTIFETMDENVPEEITQRIGRIEHVNAASINITAAATEHDGSKRILTFERHNAKERIEEGFDRLYKMAEKIGGDAMHTIKDIIIEARNLVEIEIDEESNLKQSEIAFNNYSGVELSAEDQKFTVRVPQVFAYGDAYEYMEYMEGGHFNELKTSTAEQLQTKQTIAKIYLTLEFMMTLTGKEVDRDRHGDNTRITDTQIGLFDFGGLDIEPPTENQKKALFDVFSSLISSENSFIGDMQSTIDSAIENYPEHKSFLRKQEQRFLSLGDYLKLLTTEDIRDAFISALKSPTVDPIYTEGIAIKFGIPKEVISVLGGSVSISRNDQQYTWNKPQKIIKPPKEKETRVFDKKYNKQGSD